MHLYFPVSFSIYFHLSSTLCTQSSNHPFIYIFISNLFSIFVSRSSYALNSCINISISNLIFVSHFLSIFIARPSIALIQSFLYSYFHLTWFFLLIFYLFSSPSNYYISFSFLFPSLLSPLHSIIQSFLYSYFHFWRLFFLIFYQF